MGLCHVLTSFSQSTATWANDHLNFYSIGVNLGYGQISKKTDAFQTTASAGGLKTFVSTATTNSNSSNNSTNQSEQTTAGTSESIPVNLEFIKYKISESYNFWGFGIEYQTFLQSPTFYTPIRGTSDLAYKESYTSHSIGFLVNTSVRTSRTKISSFLLLPQIGFGRRWNFDKISYSDKFKKQYPNINDQKVSLKGSFYVSTSLGATISLGKFINIIFTGKFFPVDYYEELNSVQRTKMQHWQGTIGLVKHLGKCNC